MARAARPSALVTLSTLVFLTLLVCTKVVNPFENRNNAGLEVDISAAPT